MTLNSQGTDLQVISLVFHSRGKGVAWLLRLSLHRHVEIYRLLVGTYKGLIGLPFFFFFFFFFFAVRTHFKVALLLSLSSCPKYQGGINVKQSSND